MSPQRKSRKELLQNVHRAVVKVGSGVLTGQNGLNRTVMNDLAASICTLRKRGVEIVLVSSGAIAAGLKRLGMPRRPSAVAEQQALAALGQSGLMRAWEEAFERRRFQKVAQVLLTRDDLTHRRRYLNARNTLRTLLDWGIVPIINENDTVVVDEIKFGDNDNLSAMVTQLCEAQLLINLTNIDGLFDSDPRTQENAKLLPLVESVNQRVRRMAGTIPGFLGTGGMASKVRAAHQVSLAGKATIIANGTKPGILLQLFQGKQLGTLFLPQDPHLCSRKRWIAFTKAPRGELLIDHGAQEAILKHGKSLLPSGIREVRGRFGQGDAVLLRSLEGVELAVGLSNYPAGEVSRIMGCKTSQIEAILGYREADEVIHRDNLAVTHELRQGEEPPCH